MNPQMEFRPPKADQITQIFSGMCSREICVICGKRKGSAVAF